MADKHNTEKQDGFSRGYNDIPFDGQIRAMSYLQLSEVFHSCEKNSVKYHVVEREVKRRLAKDQAEINRPNMLLAATVGGTFALAGVLLGAYLKDSPTTQLVSPSTAVQQISNNDLAPKSSSSGSIATGKIPAPPTK